MPRLFKRDYSLSIVSVDGEVKTIRDLRLKFEVTKSLISYPNAAKIELYNGNEDTLSRLQERNTKVILNLGYEGDLGLVFSGQVKNVFQQRTPPDTSVVVYAGDSQLQYTNTTFNKTIGDNVSLIEIVKQLALSFGFGTPDLSTLQLDVKKLGGQTLTGSSAALLDQLADQFDFDWTLQDDEVLLLAKNAVLPDLVTLVSADTGLIGSPTLTELGVDATMFINHRISIGSLIRVKSDNVNVSLPNLQQRSLRRPSASGDYKVLKLEYKGDLKRDGSGPWVVTATGQRL